MIQSKQLNFFMNSMSFQIKLNQIRLAFLLYLSNFTKMKKMLLMGNSGAGKTSMHSVIFANFPAKDTAKLGYTVQRQEHKFNFMGSLTLNLWDCGGQDTFMQNYFNLLRETIFKGVQVLIYVFDIEQEQKKLKKSLDYWQQTIKYIAQYNQKTNIFVLIHKMDKFPHQPERKKKIADKIAQINEVVERANEVKVKKYFATSIWDETLYQAWSEIVQLLIPNRQFIRDLLKQFCELSLCKQAVLFQRSTFLILSHYDSEQKNDLLKYEKVANIIKQYKLCIDKLGSNISSIEVSTPYFTCLVKQLTKTQNILAIYNLKQVTTELVTLNVVNMGKHFNKKKQLSFENQGRESS